MTSVRRYWCVISGFHHKVDENCALLGYYAASSGNFLPTFQDTLWFPSLEVEKTKGLYSWSLKIEPIGCPETSVISYHYCLRNNPEERSSQTILVFDLPQSVLFCFLSCLSWWPTGVATGVATSTRQLLQVLHLRL